MKSKIAIALVLLCTIYGCVTKNSNETSEKEEITSTGFWIPDDVEEMPGLKQGPFIHLKNGNIFTIEGDKSYISEDGGKTWTEYSVVADTTKFDIFPGALIRINNGVIILSFSNLKEKANWNWDTVIHDSPGATLPTYAIRSLDGGKTWQDLQKLHNAWTGANRDMIETEDGTVVFTSMIMRHNPGHHTVVTYASKDDGKTWKQSNIIDLGGSGTHGGVMESTLVQLMDGRLWMLLRTNFGDFWQTFSSDDGLTWEDIGPTDIDASSSPGLIKRLQSGRLVLVWNRLYKEGEKEGPLTGGDSDLTALPVSWQRKELLIMFSDNDGNTWDKPVVIAKRMEKSKNRLSYPEVFEAKPGELWITTRQGGRKKGFLKIKLNENDFISK